MKRMTLGGGAGRTGIEVSEFCLGSMTWGTQNSEAEAHEQIDHALAQGCDFIDTAEMYPVNPVKAETVGRTEELIGTWNAKGRRADAVIATKMSGDIGFVRDGRGINPSDLVVALEGSLRRLQTDYIDLYQFHWPNRGSFHFRKVWDFDPTGPDTAEIRQHMADVMGTLEQLQQAGKIRAFGLSNDSTWGTMGWLRAAESGGPRVATMQNEYSLMCRQYDTDLAEMAVHEDVTLLAFSPLACGILSGKYLDGAVPKGTRLDLTPGLGGRISARMDDAVRAYSAVAAKHGLDLVQMALAWTRTRPFPTIPIFGATSMAQLDTALGAADLVLSEDVLADIAEAHKAHPMPF
jgi:aryl-alcohol dehydrogenase-like predicted oxidoreductase